MISHDEQVAIIDHIPVLRRQKKGWRNLHQQRMWTSMGLEIFAAADALGYELVRKNVDRRCPRCGGDVDSTELSSPEMTAKIEYCRRPVCGWTRSSSL